MAGYGGALVAGISGYNQAVDRRRNMAYQDYQLQRQRDQDAESEQDRQRQIDQYQNFTQPAQQMQLDSARTAVTRAEANQAFMHALAQAKGGDLSGLEDVANKYAGIPTRLVKNDDGSIDIVTPHGTGHAKDLEDYAWGSTDPKTENPMGFYHVLNPEAAAKDVAEERKSARTENREAAKTKEAGDQRVREIDKQGEWTVKAAGVRTDRPMPFIGANGQVLMYPGTGDEVRPLHVAGQPDQPFAGLPAGRGGAAGHPSAWMQQFDKRRDILLGGVKQDDPDYEMKVEIANKAAMAAMDTSKAPSPTAQAQKVRSQAANILGSGISGMRFNSLKPEEQRAQVDSLAKVISAVASTPADGGAPAAGINPQQGGGAAAVQGAAGKPRPTLEEFLPQARRLNPGVNDAQLQRFYEQKYGAAAAPTQ